MSEKSPTLLSQVNTMAQLAKDIRTDSLSEYSRATRIEPLTLIEESIQEMPHDIRNSILQTALSVYAGWYLHAVQLKASVGNVSVLSVLDQFATDRDADTDIGGGWSALAKVFGVESLDDPTMPASMTSSLDGFMNYGIEAKGNDSFSNIAIGKELNVPVTIEGKKFDIKTTVRLSIDTLSTQGLLSTLAMDTKDNTMRGRYLRWRAREISFFDYVTCMDMIDADKKGLLNDQNGIYTEKRGRKSASLVAALISGSASVNVASSITVITKSTAKALEMEMRGELSNYRVRERMFDDTLSTMLIVVDPLSESIRLYSRGISDDSLYTFDDIANNSTNGDGVDINAVARAFKGQQQIGLM